MKAENKHTKNTKNGREGTAYKSDGTFWACFICITFSPYMYVPGRQKVLMKIDNAE